MVTQASPKFHFTHFFLIIIIIIRCSGMFHVPGFIDGHYTVVFTREFIMIHLGSLERDYSLFRVFIGVITLDKG